MACKNCTASLGWQASGVYKDGESRLGTMMRWIDDGDENSSLTCSPFTKVLKADGACLFSKARLIALDVGVASNEPLADEDANRFVKSNMWQNTALAPSSGSAECQKALAQIRSLRVSPPTFWVAIVCVSA